MRVDISRIPLLLLCGVLGFSGLIEASASDILASSTSSSSLASSPSDADITLERPTAAEPIEIEIPAAVAASEAITTVPANTATKQKSAKKKSSKEVAGLKAKGAAKPKKSTWTQAMIRRPIRTAAMAAGTTALAATALRQVRRRDKEQKLMTRESSQQKRAKMLGDSNRYRNTYIHPEPLPFVGEEPTYYAQALDRSPEWLQHPVPMAVIGTAAACADSCRDWVETADQTLFEPYREHPFFVWNKDLAVWDRLAHLVDVSKSINYSRETRARATRVLELLMEELGATYEETVSVVGELYDRAFNMEQIYGDLQSRRTQARAAAERSNVAGPSGTYSGKGKARAVSPDASPAVVVPSTSSVYHEAEPFHLQESGEEGAKTPTKRKFDRMTAEHEEQEGSDDAIQGDATPSPLPSPEILISVTPSALGDLSPDGPSTPVSPPSDANDEDWADVASAIRQE